MRHESASLFLTFALCLALAACRGPQTLTEPAPEPAAEAPAHAAGDAAPALNTAQQSGEDWEAHLTRLRQDAEVTQQQKTAQAERHYEMASRHYEAGDFERSRTDCQKALQIDPDHKAARALLSQIDFTTNRGTATAESDHFRKIIQEAEVRHQQVLLQIDEKLSSGQKNFNLGQYAEAEEDFRTVLENAKWLPTGIDLESRRRLATEWLERTKQAHRQALLETEKSRLATIKAESEREEIRRIHEQKRTLETLFGQAQLHFEREEYPACVNLCNRILYIDPTLESVQEMRSVASRLRYKKEDQTLLDTYIREWKRTFEQIELAGLTQTEVIEWPDRDNWDLVRSRKPQSLHADEDQEMSAADRDILEKLNSLKVPSLVMNEQPLLDVIQYLEQFSGLNFIPDLRPGAIENPESLTVTIDVKNYPLRAVLDYILSRHNLGYQVENGVILITTGTAIRGQNFLEVYDIRDILYGPPNFPGIEISMQQDPGGGLPPEDTGGGAIDGEQVADLIKKSIDKDHWEDEGKFITVHETGLLIVRNTRDVHGLIRQFLQDLRASTGILVNLETRFLLVEDNWLQQVGMDLRDVNGSRAVGILALDDINPAFALNPQFVSPGGGLSSNSAGMVWQGGDSIRRRMGLRAQHIMVNDIIINRFFTQSLNPAGGMSMQYTLMDDISLEAVMRLVSRSNRGHLMTATKMTLFNAQQGNIRLQNQFSYIKDYDIQIATAAVAPDPIPAIVNDGISLDVKPIVSADRKFVTVDLRPTIATLNPQPPDVQRIAVNLAVPGDGAPFTAGTIEIETPVLNIQRIRSTVVIPDRGTLIIGGLTVLFELDANSSVPIWRHIPVLGQIASNEYKGLQRRQLVIILSARIVIPSEEEREMYD